MTTSNQSSGLRQQLIISGLGGQGAVTLTRLLAEAALAARLSVITSETHGMAQRGGTVISMVKVGPFRGPLILAGAADVGLFLHQGNLAVHRYYLKPAGLAVVNTGVAGDYLHLDALNLAAGLGLPPVMVNLILLGFAAGRGLLFCPAAVVAQVIQDKTPDRFREANLLAWKTGVDAAAP
jgi:indolepyruvate ferredoxin oxidoreductase beta subunit